MKEEKLCSLERTLEPETCLLVYKAKKLLEKAKAQTEHSNRDTITIDNIIDKLEFIIRVNSKEKFWEI